MADNDTHFTAVIKITKVTPAKTETDGYGKIKSQTQRVTMDLASIELRSKDLIALLAATQAHLGLVNN